MDVSKFLCAPFCPLPRWLDSLRCWQPSPFVRSTTIIHSVALKLLFMTQRRATPIKSALAHSFEPINVRNEQSFKQKWINAQIHSLATVVKDISQCNFICVFIAQEKFVVRGNFCSVFSCCFCVVPLNFAIARTTKVDWPLIRFWLGKRSNSNYIFHNPIVTCLVDTDLAIQTMMVCKAVEA